MKGNNKKASVTHHCIKPASYNKKASVTHHCIKPALNLWLQSLQIHASKHKKSRYLSLKLYYINQLEGRGGKGSNRGESILLSSWRSPWQLSHSPNTTLRKTSMLNVYSE